MLTEKKRLFCENYMITLNASDSAEKAGYSHTNKNQLRSKASKLLKDKDIKRYITKKLKERDEKLVVKQDEILQFLSNCIRGLQTERQTYVLRKGTKKEYDDQLEERDIPIKARDRIKAAEIMAKYYKLFDEGESKVINITINNDIPKKSEEQCRLLENRLI